jgi:hypothetical protein
MSVWTLPFRTAAWCQLLFTAVRRATLMEREDVNGGRISQHLAAKPARPRLCAPAQSGVRNHLCSLPVGARPAAQEAASASVRVSEGPVLPLRAFCVRGVPHAASSKPRASGAD